MSTETSRWAARREEPTEYGGGPGDNRTFPDGRPRTLSAKEEARDLRRAGIRDNATPPATR